MAVLSRNTCALAIELLDGALTRKTINLLLYKLNVPDELILGDSKKQLLLNVFRGLEMRGRQDIVFQIIQEALKHLGDNGRAKLEGALIRDGFAVAGDEIVPEETRSEEHKTALEVLIGKHGSKLTPSTLLHHLKEAEELFRLGKWDASVGQARNFVEQLLLDIARTVAASKGERPDLSAPVKVRNYLQTAGFFDEAERKKLVDGVYGYFSEEGAHPGIGEQSVARACLSVLWTFGFYVLEKFNAWPT